MSLKRKYKAYIILILLVISVVVILNLIVGNNRFREAFDVDNIMNHVETLTSERYMGRLTGSEGNENALLYIESYFEEIGLESAFENGIYRQEFSVLVPQIERTPEFKIYDSNNRIIKSFEMYVDYSAAFSPHGGPIDFRGKYVVLGSDFLRVGSEALEGKIAVIQYNLINQKVVKHIMDSGGVGILCSADSSSVAFLKAYERSQFMDVSGMGGNSIFLGYISRDTYSILQEHDNSQIEIEFSATFPIEDSTNLLGKINGTAKDGSILILSADLDGLGEGIGDAYFPGAVNSATGVAMLMETARLMKASDALPYETVIFAVWNGHNQQSAGVKHYIANPLYPLGNTRVIHLGKLGRDSLEGLSIVPDPLFGGMIANLMEKYAKDMNLSAVRAVGGSEITTLFMNEKVPAVVFTDSKATQNNYEDGVELVSSEVVENAVKVLQTYMKREIYNDRSIDYFRFNEVVLLFSILTLGGLMVFISALYKAYPNAKFMRLTLEDIYFSTAFMGIRKFYTGVLPYALVIFMLALLVNIDPDANVVQTGGRPLVNYSWYLIVKNSVMYLRDLMNVELYFSETVGNVFKVILESSRQSIVLVSISLLISTVVGVIRGMFEAYHSKKTSLGSLGSLFFFSIPDLLIILVVLLGYTRLVIAYPVLNGYPSIKGLILPLIALSIVPSVYISRITFIAIQEELGKDYIKNEKAKGFSRRRIIFVGLLPAILFKIVDAMPAVMTMLLSNMIVIEYLFNYKGILYFLVYLYNRQDVFRFVPLALTLGLIYIVFTGGFKVAAKIINPMKRKGDK